MYVGSINRDRFGGVIHRCALVLCALLSVLVISACAHADPFGEGADGHPSGRVVVGSADFPESQILAELYAGVMRDAGVEAVTEPSIGSREAYIGAVQDGSVDVVPEYSGNLLLYADPETTAQTPQEILGALPDSLPGDLSILQASEAQNKDAVVLTRQTADQYSLSSIEDMAKVCDQLVLAGPPEFKERSYGLPGLASRYGCTPQSFEPINDAGGTLTVDSLTSGQVDAANIFTTTPAIEQHDLVVLDDPKNNFMAQQVVPLTADGRLPKEAIDALNDFSTKLTTEDLMQLNQAVSGDNAISVQQAAQDWLVTKGYTNVA